MSDRMHALVDRFIGHVEGQRFAEAYLMLNPDGRFVLSGTTEASGVYEGRDDIFNRLAPKLSGFTKLPEIRFSHRVVDGAHAFLRAVGRGEGAYGAYDQPFYGYYLRAEAEGLAEIIEYLDTAQIEIALYGKKFVAGGVE